MSPSLLFLEASVLLNSAQIISDPGARKKGRFWVSNSLLWFFCCISLDDLEKMLLLVESTSLSRAALVHTKHRAPCLGKTWSPAYDLGLGKFCFFSQ